MKKLVLGISGPAGAGKSTLLEQVKTLGYAVDDFKVSRSVQVELGYETLADATATFERMTRFQCHVYDRKLQHDRTLREKHDSHAIFTERTFADIYAYTHFWTTQFVKRGDISLQDAEDFITSYYKRCFDAQNSCYDAQLLLPMMTHVVFEPDHRRAPQEAEEHTWAFIQNFAYASYEPVHIISGVTPEDRAKDVASYVKELQDDQCTV
jgi:predicted ATPase